jgi:hypothetical protein
MAPSALDHSGKARRGERCAPLRRKDVGRFRVLLTLKPSQRPQFVGQDGMSARRAPLHPADMQRSRGKLHLIPAEVNETKTVTIGHQDHRRIAMPPPVLPGRIHEALNFSFSQVLACP